VVVPSYVTLEGAGENVTWIVGTRDDAMTGVVALTNSFRAAVRSVSIGHLGAVTDAVALSVFQSRDIRVDHVRLTIPPAVAGGVALLVASHSSAATDSSDVDVKDSWLSATVGARTEQLSGGVAQADLISTQLIGGTDVTLGGAVRCVGCYDGVFNLLDINCSP